MKTLIVFCTFAIIVAVIATPFLNSNYTRWREQDLKIEAEMNDADMAYAHCQNVNSGKTFQEVQQLCDPYWDRYRDTKDKYKNDFWLRFLFSGK